MASNAAVLLVTDVEVLPESVEQWVNKTYEDKLSAGAVQILTNIQEAGEHSLSFSRSQSCRNLTCIHLQIMPMYGAFVIISNCVQCNVKYLVSFLLTS